MIVLNKFPIYIKRWKNTTECCIWKIYRLIKKITIVKKDLKARNVSSFNRNNCNESFFSCLEVLTLCTMELTFDLQWRLLSVNIVFERSIEGVKNFFRNDLCDTIRIKNKKSDVTISTVFSELLCFQRYLLLCFCTSC